MGTSKGLKLKMTTQEFEFLAGWLRHIVSNEPPEDMLLEYYVAGEMYERYIKKMTFIRPGSITLKMSEAIAIRMLLLATPINDDYTDIMRNYLFNKINAFLP